MSNLEKHLISKKESKLLAVEYEKSNYEAINQKRPADKPDSKVYIYELEVLQDYINLIRDGMEKKGIKNKGIKITLGKYPEHDSDRRLNPIYKGYQTIFFSEENLGFSMGNDQASRRGQEGEELPDLNYGQICPPY